MENNCLVTKLKASVDNANLSKLGILRLWVGTNSSLSGYNVTASGSFNWSNDVKVVSGDATLTRYSNIQGIIVPGSQPSLVEISNKYLLRVINGQMARKIIAEELSAIPLTTLQIYGAYQESNTNGLYGDLSTLNVSNLTGEAVIAGVKGQAYGNIPSFENTTITSLRLLGCWDCTFNSQLPTSVTSLDLNYTKCPMDISNFANLTNVATIKILSNELYGDISDLGYKASITNLIITSPKVTGNIEDYLELFYGQRTSTDFAFDVVGTAIKLHGATIGYAHKAEFTASTIKIVNTFNNTLVATYDGTSWSYS